MSCTLKVCVVCCMLSYTRKKERNKVLAEILGEEVSLKPLLKAVSCFQITYLTYIFSLMSFGNLQISNSFIEGKRQQANHTS